MPLTAEEAVVHKSILVRAPLARAWSVFVEQMETWWPATHHIGSTPFESSFVEPRVGGRWYERNVDGAQCDWGKVLAWDPPHRVCFSWHLGPGHDQPDWKFDPDPGKASEVEFSFAPEGPSATRINLEHRCLERHGKGYEQLVVLFNGPGAWVGILDSYARAIETSAAAEGATA